MFLKKIINLFKQHRIDVTLIQLMNLEQEYGVHHMWQLRPFLKNEFNATIDFYYGSGNTWTGTFATIKFKKPKYKTVFLLKYSELLSYESLQVIIK